MVTISWIDTTEQAPVHFILEGWRDTKQVYIMILTHEPWSLVNMMGEQEHFHDAPHPLLPLDPLGWPYSPDS